MFSALSFLSPLSSVTHPCNNLTRPPPDPLSFGRTASSQPWTLSAQHVSDMSFDDVKSSNADRLTGLFWHLSPRRPTAAIGNDMKHLPVSPVPTAHHCITAGQTAADRHETALRACAAAAVQTAIHRAGTFADVYRLLETRRLLEVRY